MVYKISVAVIAICVAYATIALSWYVGIRTITDLVDSSDSAGLFDDSEEWIGDSPLLSHCTEKGAVVVIPVHGTIEWYPTEGINGFELYGLLEDLRNSESYSGVVLDIDSLGGYPVASFRIAEAISALGIPSVAVVHDSATSGGYAIAAASDYIVAHPISDVGSIAITSSYVNESGANSDMGYIYESLSTGRFKDAGDPAKSLTDEEREFMIENLEHVHEYFVDLVAKYRALPHDTVAALADGKWYAADKTMEYGLVDALGGTDEAIVYIESKVHKQNLPVCYAPAL